MSSPKSPLGHVLMAAGIIAVITFVVPTIVVMASHLARWLDQHLP